MKTSLYLIVGLSFIFLSEVNAQKKIKTITVADKVVSATVDRPGELYIVTNKGTIQRFDNAGALVSEYKNQSSPTLFDPRDGARLFAYYRHDQHYVFLSPTFDVTKSLTLDPSLAVEPWLTCVSGDYNLWILDAADVSLKKINVQSSSVEGDYKIADSLVQRASDISFMREYQGFLFLLHKTKGILIFNKMGKCIKIVSRPNLLYFNFLGEELYYPDGGHLMFLNLFTAETRETPMPETGDFILLTDERMYTVKGSTLGVFSLNP